MKFLDALRGPSAQRSVQVLTSLEQLLAMQPGQYPLGFQTTYGHEPAEPIGNSFVDYVLGGLQSNGIIFALEQKRLQVFSQARFQFQRMRNGRPGDLFGDRSLSILERPWIGGTTGDMLARMIIDADFAGNNWQVELEDEIVRLRPDWVEIILESREVPRGEDGQMVKVGYRQVGIMYYQGGIRAGEKPAVFLPGEYSHFAPIPDPLAGYRGMSWLTPVIREIQADTQATKHKLKFFENAATPNLAVSLAKEITPDQFEAFVAKMDAAHRGADNAYKTLYTAGGADVTVIGQNLQQLDFKVTQGAGETRLAAAAGVHPVIVGLSEGMQGSSLNAGNYTSAKRSFVDTTCRHLWQNASGSLETLVPPPADSRLWYDARDIPFLHEDQKDVAQIQQAQASAWRQLVDGGMTPDAATAFIQTNDLSVLLGQHSGLYSVQLQPPGSGETGTEAPTARPGSAVRHLPSLHDQSKHGRKGAKGLAKKVVKEVASWTADVAPAGSMFPKGYRADPTPEQLSTIQKVFGGDHGNLQVKDLHMRFVGDSTVEFDGQIRDRSGKHVGYFSRTLDRESDGKLVATHDKLHLDKQAQGQGFAESFNGRLIEWYKASGVSQIQLSANIDVGGYAWARAGYDWFDEDAPEDPLRRLERIVSSGAKLIPADRLDEQKKLARQMLKRFETAEFGSPDYPTPFEVAQLGRWPGAGRDDWWVGKAALMGSSWDGVKPL